MASCLDNDLQLWGFHSQVTGRIQKHTKTSRRVGNGTCRRTLPLSTSEQPWDLALILLSTMIQNLLSCWGFRFFGSFFPHSEQIFQKSQSPHGCASGMPCAYFRSGARFPFARFVLSRLGYLSATQPKQVLMLRMFQPPTPPHLTPPHQWRVASSIWATSHGR